jgi:hypothetical protein
MCSDIAAISRMTRSCDFPWRAVKIPFRFDNIACAWRETYSGERISRDVVRRGKCPAGTVALKIRLKSGPLRDHLVVCDDIDAAVRELKLHELLIG